MKTKLALISALAVIGLGSSAVAEPWEDLLNKLYPAAKEEGEVIFNTERLEEVGGKEGLAAFQARFPGIEVTLQGAAGSDLPARLGAEAKAGKVSIDMFRNDIAPTIIMAKAGLLEAIDPAEITDQKVTMYLDNTFVKLSDHITNFAYNTDLVKPEEAPKTYEDLLDPKWKGRLALDARGGQIAHLLSRGIWAEDKFWDFVKGLKAQEPVWTTRNTEAMAKITSGEAAIGTGSYAAVEELKEQGAPIEFLFLSPSLAQVRGASIVKGAPHPNASKLFLGWLLSPEGLAARDKNAVGTVTPGTHLYDQVQAHNANLVYEETVEQVVARDGVGKKITAEWGVLK